MIIYSRILWNDIVDMILWTSLLTDFSNQSKGTDYTMEYSGDRIDTVDENQHEKMFTIYFKVRKAGHKLYLQNDPVFWKGNWLFWKMRLWVIYVSFLPVFFFFKSVVNVCYFRIKIKQISFNISLSLFIIKIPTVSKTLWQSLAGKNSVQFSIIKNIVLTAIVGVLIILSSNLSSFLFKIFHLEQVAWSF